MYVDFHDEITTPEGETIHIRDAMDTGPGEPPRISARFWDEFSGKQTSLPQFFAGGGKGSSQIQPSSASQSFTPTVATPVVPSPVHAEPSPTPPTPAPSSSQPPASTSTKRKFAPEPVSVPKKAKKVKEIKGQKSIASFFAKPSTSQATEPPSSSQTVDPDTEDEDYKLALQLSQEHDSTPGSSQQLSLKENGKDNMVQTKQTWSTLLAPIQAPRCQRHGEIAKEYKVSKAGPNKGKKFFLCSRCVIPHAMMCEANQRYIDPLVQATIKARHSGGGNTSIPSTGATISSGRAMSEGR